MDDERVNLIEKEAAFEGYFRIDRYRLRHRLHQGGWSNEMTREIFERGHAVAVLPYDPRRDEIVLIEQFRIGPFARRDDPWIVECVAGIIEDGERPEDVARRETREETGLAATDLVPVSSFYVSPGGTSQFNVLFCAHVDSSDAGGIHGLDHEHEDIRVIPTPAVRVPELLGEGTIRDATTLIALQWLIANRAQVRRMWLPDA